MILKVVEGFTRFSDIDVVERVLDVSIHAPFNLKHLLWIVECLAEVAGARRGNHIDGPLYLIVRGGLPHDGIGIAQRGVVGVLAGHEPHLLCRFGANGVMVDDVGHIGMHSQREVLAALSGGDVLDLIAERLVLHKVFAHHSNVRLVLLTGKGNDALARLNDAGVGILFDGVSLSRLLAIQADEEFKSLDDILGLVLLLGVGRCECAASNEQHDE